MKKLTTIDPEMFYSVAEIIRHRFFPWIKSIPTLVKWLDYQYDEDKQLIVYNSKGTGPGKRYYIKGSDIIKLKKLLEQGRVQIN